ncbi:MAG: hypothetical protein LW701_04390 [Fluviicola sp.]|jgi:hypothetical protein|nr:hypothetical protein [Fluviicola sp.]
MKTIPYFSPIKCLFFSSMVGFSFHSSNQNTSVRLVDFHAAISSRQIKSSAKSVGGHAGACILLKLKNTSVSALKVNVPQGSLFYPADKGEQTLISMEDQYVLLNPGQEIESKISGYCCEHHDRSPMKDRVFSFGKNKMPKFDSLFVQMKGKKIPNHTFQDIVWAVSDNSPVSNISSDSEELKQLRKYLFKATKQLVVEYSCATYSRIESDGRINTYPYNIKGDLEFKVDHATFISQEVYTKEGKLKDKLPLSFSVLAGKTKFGFNVNVKGWDRGDYVLKLKSGKEEVATYEFSI